MVSRPAQVWQRAALGIRHGHRALCRVDLRAGTCTRDDTVRSDAESDLSLGLLRALNNLGESMRAAGIISRNSQRKQMLSAARPTWISGAARLVDLGGVFDRYLMRSGQAPSPAANLARDWQVVGERITKAWLKASSERLG